MRLAGKFVGSGKNEKNQRVARPTRSCTRMYARRESSLSFFWVTERERKEEKEPQMGNANIPITSHWLGLNSGERETYLHIIPRWWPWYVHKLLIFLQESDIGFLLPPSPLWIGHISGLWLLFQTKPNAQGHNESLEEEKRQPLPGTFIPMSSKWMGSFTCQGNTHIQLHSTTYDGSWRNESWYINKPREWISDV